MLLVDLNQDKSSVNKYLSNTLLTKIEENLKNGKKVILYLNKRWDYSSLVCSKCNFLYKCNFCDTSLSLHGDLMVCHICGFTRKVPQKCDKCGSFELQKVWVWTKQIEKALSEIFVKFPPVYLENLEKTNNKQGIVWEDIIFRLDTDIIKNSKDKKEALERLKFAKIIIWTKMITTGFDFSNVGLIWVILLEQELQFPKYNTTEKLYSNLKQFLWRWWRKGEETEVVIQTFIPENEIIKTLIFSNYKEFFKKTLTERKIFNYPPFCEFVTVEYRDKDKKKAFEFTKKIYEKLKAENTTENRIEIILNETSFKKFNQYHYKIILKWQNLRKFLLCIKNEIFKNSNLIVIFG
jgi:primosomal protein N' (replication factor Y)